MHPQVQELGVEYLPGPTCFADGSGANQIRLSFSFVEDDLIEPGIRIIGDVASADLREARASVGRRLLRESTPPGPAAARRLSLQRAMHARRRRPGARRVPHGRDRDPGHPGSTGRAPASAAAISRRSRAGVEVSSYALVYDLAGIPLDDSPFAGRPHRLPRHPPPARSQHAASISRAFRAPRSASPMRSTPTARRFRSRRDPMLRRQVEAARDAGFEVRLATELEFYLFWDDLREARGSAIRGLEPTTPARSTYGIAAAIAQQPFLASGLRRRWKRPAFRSARHRPKPGAGSGRSTSTTPIRSRRRITTSSIKPCVKEMARQAGLTVTFMARPVADDLGSSCHLHCLALGAMASRCFPTEPGSGAALVDGTPRRSAGCWSISPATAIFFAPFANSYKRHAPGFAAGRVTAWGQDNRSVAIRVAGQASRCASSTDFLAPTPTRIWPPRRSSRPGSMESQPRETPDHRSRATPTRSATCPGPRVTRRGTGGVRELRHSSSRVRKRDRRPLRRPRSRRVDGDPRRGHRLGARAGIRSGLDVAVTETSVADLHVRHRRDIAFATIARWRDRVCLRIQPSAADRSSLARSGRCVSAHDRSGQCAELESGIRVEDTTVEDASRRSPVFARSRRAA